jgi:aspartate aminotransferase
VLFAERLLKDAHVAVVPGEAFHAPGFIRISFACEKPVLKKALTRLKTFIDTYRTTYS